MAGEKPLDNLYAAGMMITSDHDAHMSTRNTVCCMGQGQGAGAAAALPRIAMTKEIRSQPVHGFWTRSFMCFPRFRAALGR